MFEICVEKTFAAAHFLPGYAGPCSRLHGHNYRVRVYLRGTSLDDNGLLCDFGTVKTALNEVLGRYDHFTLNDLPDFKQTAPSTENVAFRIAEAMQKFTFGEAIVHRVEVQETPNQSATYYLSGA